MNIDDNMAELRRKNAEEGFTRLWHKKAIDALMAGSGKALSTCVPPRDEFVAGMMNANPKVG